jgi:thymidylate synthase
VPDAQAGEDVKVINVRNVHDALPIGLDLLGEVGFRRDSRNGPVIQFPGPVTTVYDNPAERVLFHAWRGANPFFHLAESLWMLAGRKDIAPVTRYVKRMADFSDDGVSFNAAYGRRWRRARLDVRNTDDGPLNDSRDQLVNIVNLLRKNPLDRQCVLQIWDHTLDLGTQTKDHACNLIATFQLSTGGCLDMVVFCRSNDVIMGAYGANAVHYSMLHEYIARCSGLPIGVYEQVSVNYHVYERDYQDMRNFQRRPLNTDRGNPYSLGEVAPYPLVTMNQEVWDEDVREFVTSDGRAPPQTTRFTDPFFSEVAVPVVTAHDHYKDGIGLERYAMALHAVSRCAATDWRRACTEWLEGKRHNEMNRMALT